MAGQQRDIFAFQRKCLRVVCYRFDEQPHDRRTVRWWHTILHLMPFVLVAGSQLPIMYFFIYNIQNIGLATRSIAFSFNNAMTVTKIFTFLWYRGEFVELIEAFNRMYNNVDDPMAKGLLRSSNRFAARIARTYFIMCSVTGLYLHCEPVVKYILANLHGEPVVFRMATPMRFPFDYLHTPGYQCAALFSFLSSCTVIVYASAVDNLFTSFSFNLGGHFKALQYFIRHKSYDQTTPRDQHRFLSAYIQYHARLLNLSKKLNAIYKPVVFGEFLLVSLLLCVILHQMVTNMTSISVLVVNSVFLSSIMVQLLIYCYGGEILRNESSMVSMAIQLSNWYDLSLNNQKLYLLAMRRSQRAVIMKSAFYEASLENFMVMVQASGSYITLILSFE